MNRRQLKENDLKVIIEMKIVLIFLCVFSFSINAQGQNKLLDSLHTLQQSIEKRAEYENDTTYINVLYELAKAFRYTQLDSMLYYATKNLLLAQKIGYTKKQPKILRQIAAYYFEKEDYRKSIDYYKKGLQIAEITHDKEDLAFACYNISNSYIRSEEYTHSLDLALRATKLFEEIVKTNKDMTAWLAHAHGNLATIYQSQKKWDKSLEHNQKSIELSRANHYSYGVALGYNSIGYVYIEQKKYQQGYDAIAKSNELLNFLGLDHKDHISSSNLFYMGIGYKEQGKLKEALHNIKQAYEISVKYQRKKTQAEFGAELIATYFKLKQYKKVLEYGLPLLALAQRFGLKLEIKNISGILADTYQVMADYKKAFFYQSISKVYQDSLFNDQSREKIIQLEYQYEYEKKEISLKEEQKAEIKAVKKIAEAKFNTLIMFGVLFLVFATAIAYLIYRSRAAHKNLNVLLTQKNDLLEQQQHELQAINQTKDKLFSIIGHDLRSPMNSLIGLMDLVSQKAISPQVLQIYTDKLKTNVREVAFTLNNLLYWAKGQMQGLVINPQAFSLHTLAEKNFNLMQEVAFAKKITLINLVHQNITLWADKDHADLVLRNLLNNAIKFTPVEGTIIVAATQKSNVCEISVRDNGVGITAENLTKIFRSNLTFTTQGTAGEKGTGLGLSMCQEMIEMNGGKIWVESELGKGTTIFFTIPMENQ